MFHKKSRFLKPGWLVLFFLGIVISIRVLTAVSFGFNETIVIEQWDTIKKFTDKLPFLSSLKVRWYIKNNLDHAKSLQLWSYIFSGSYTPNTFVDIIDDWPSRSFTKIRLLEWRSIYDIDEYLTKQWYILWWEYIKYVSEISNIQPLSEKFNFIKLFTDTKPQNTSTLTLEWLLYPDTYHLSKNQPIIPQLVSLQLQAFRDKVFIPFVNDFNSFSKILENQWYSFSLWFYNIITLASVVEKEERLDKNKPLIAGIFMNRIQNNMRIDADITLCYGLRRWYEVCTPSVIAQSIDDENNIYNTRKKRWLPPTPIANSSVVTIESVLNFKKTANLFYLHDEKGSIWTADSLEWHNNNKSTHL